MDNKRTNQTQAWPIWCLSMILIAVDLRLGPDYQFALLYIIPVAWAAWSRGFTAAAVLSIIFCIARFICHWAWGFPTSITSATVNTVLRCVTLITVSLAAAQLAWKIQKLKRRIQQLETHFPVCSSCSQVQKEDQWIPIDIPTPSDERETTLCPHCKHKTNNI